MSATAARNALGIVLGIAIGPLVALAAHALNVGQAITWIAFLGSIVAGLAYLALAPVVLHLHSRLIAVVAGRGESTGVVNLVTFGGLGFSLVGAIGAALFGSSPGTR